MEKSFEFLSFFLPSDGKHRAARRNAEKTIGKQPFATLEEQRPETIYIYAILIILEHIPRKGT